MLSGLSPLTNLMAHYIHLLKHIRRNMLTLTLSVPMQSNRTCFFYFSGCSEAYNLSRYPQWDTLNSRAAEQAYSSLQSFKGFLSYINEKNFMTHCIFCIVYILKCIKQFITVGLRFKACLNLYINKTK